MKQFLAITVCCCLSYMAYCQEIDNRPYKFCFNLQVNPFIDGFYNPQLTSLKGAVGNAYYFQIFTSYRFFSFLEAGISAGLCHQRFGYFFNPYDEYKEKYNPYTTGVYVEYSPLAGNMTHFVPGVFAKLNPFDLAGTYSKRIVPFIKVSAYKIFGTYSYANYWEKPWMQPLHINPNEGYFTDTKLRRPWPEVFKQDLKPMYVGISAGLDYRFSRRWSAGLEVGAGTFSRLNGSVTYSFDIKRKTKAQ